MVTHAISATYSRFDRMSPTAAALAVLLHVLTALALWWVSPLNRSHPEEEPIEVTIEQPKPPPPPVQQPAPQPTPQPTPPPAPPMSAPKPPPPPPAVSTPLGLPPPPSKTGDTRQEAVPKSEPDPKPDTKPEPPQQAVAPPEPKPEPKPELQPEPPPKPAIEKVLPPLEAPPPPLTSRDFPQVAPPAPPKPAPTPVPQQARPVPTPPAPVPPAAPQIKPSPLQTSPMKRVPESSSNDASATFVNPASRYSQSKLTDDYIWKVVNKFSQYLPDLRQKGEGGSLTLRFVIARDGRLIDVTLLKSSGVAALDRGMLDAVRAASPYPPFPSELTESQISYTLPLQAKENR